MNESQSQIVRDEIEKIEALGHGEVTIKIKNGYIWRILSTNDTLLTQNKECVNM